MSNHIIADSEISLEELHRIYTESKNIFLGEFYDDKKKEYLKGYRGKARSHREESFSKNADVDFLKSHCAIGFDDLDIIFSVANTNRNTFPQIRMGKGPTVQKYLVKWINAYFKAAISSPSQREATPKSSCSDPAVCKIVQEVQSLTEQQITDAEKTHNLFMSAENVQGNLLEEYIANKIRPYGYLWCQGNVLRSIDFCSSDGTHLIQIKNKHNSENSSSSHIREGTEIQKWYRLGTVHKNGIAVPCYKWDVLNEYVSAHRTSGHTLGKCNLSEEDYLDFLKKVAAKNPHLISGI